MEDRLNQMRGYKATLSNPNVSDEAKEHARSALDELGGDQPQQELHSARGDQNKDPTRRTAGLKAAVHNPSVTDEGKESAKEQLGRETSQE